MLWSFVWEFHYVIQLALLQVLTTQAGKCPVTMCKINTGRFIIFSVIRNIYNKKTKGPTLMELFTATGKLKKMLTRVWQELEYHIDVCRVTRGAHIEHL